VLSRYQVYRRLIITALCNNLEHLRLTWYCVLDWIVQCFTSPPTQYRLYGRRFIQVKRPNQQYKVLKEMLQRKKQRTKIT